jgi:hypothetical protein
MRLRLNSVSSTTTFHIIIEGTLMMQKKELLFFVLMCQPKKFVNKRIGFDFFEF